MAQAAKWIMALAAAATMTAMAGVSLADRNDEPGERGRNGPGRRDGVEGNDAPTTRPAGGGGWGGGGGRGADSGRDQQPPTAEEWLAVEEFMQENSPKRLELFRRMEKEYGGERVGKIRSRIAARYRFMEQFRDRDAEMYDFSLKQLRIEDQVLTTLVKIRQAGDSPELQDALKAQMQSFVDNAINERAARIIRLEELLKKEKGSLAKDRGQIDEVMERQRERFEKDMRRLLDFDASTDDKQPTTAPAEKGR